MADNLNAAAEQAQATVVANLAGPYFFHKLASAGIHARSEKEAGEMWAAAQKLHVLYKDEQEKAAAAQSTEMESVNAELNQVLAAAGFGGQIGNEKQAAFDHVAALAADQPDIANAVLTLQAAAYNASQPAKTE